MDPIPRCENCVRILQGLERIQQRLNDQDAQLRQLRQELLLKDARIEALEKRNTELEKRAHSSAAPFRKKPQKRNATGTPSGRKPGHDPAYRPPPLDTASIETVEAPLGGCPHCHGPVEQIKRREQIIEDLPPIEPIYRRVITYAGQCPHCGPVASRHPFQVSQAQGAAGVHLGPRALALAADLRHSTGLTMRKTCYVLGEHFHLRLTPGGLSQALCRTARKLLPEYEGLQQQARESESVHADETGWWLEAKHAWLWVVATTRVTIYRVSAKRDAAVLESLLGKRYAGTLVSDCLNIYDRYEAARKSKCVAHHLRAIGAAQQEGGESPFLAGAKRVFKAALKLDGMREKLPAAVYERGVKSLERRLDRLLAQKHRAGGEERIAKRLCKQREHLFTFLWRKEVAATNNLAERQLRPAVITRKLSCGNKTERGARTWEVLASVAATCRQRGVSFTERVASRLRLGGVEPRGAPP